MNISNHSTYSQIPGRGAARLGRNKAELAVRLLTDEVKRLEAEKRCLRAECWVRAVLPRLAAALAGVGFIGLMSGWLPGQAGVAFLAAGVIIYILARSLGSSYHTRQAFLSELIERKRIAIEHCRGGLSEG